MTDYTKSPIRQLRIAAMNMVMAARADRNVSAECYRYADALQTAIAATKEIEEQSAHPTEDREGLINVTDAEAAIIAAAIGMLKNYGSTRDRILRLLTQGNIGRVYDKIDKKVII